MSGNKLRETLRLPTKGRVTVLNRSESSKTILKVQEFVHEQVLAQLKVEQKVVEIHLINGKVIDQAQIIDFDRYTVLVQRHSIRSLVFKSAICQIDENRE